MIQINPLKSYIDGGVRAALTTPPSASLVFDLPGKAIWVKGVKLKGIDHTYTFSHDNYITLTNTPDKNNPESEDINIGVNITTLKNVIDTTYNGGTLALLQEGINTEERTWLAKILHNYINNVLPITKNLQINGTNYAIYTTEDSLPLFFAPVSLGTVGQILACTSSGLSWINLIQNTDYRVSLSSATNNSDYRIILKQEANNNPETNFVRFSEYLTFNPSTKILKINNTKVITATDIYVGSTANATAGLVPAATSEQLNYYLRGDGTWVNIATEMATANTWRPIKVENTDALGSSTDTGTLSFTAGTGITLAWDATNKRIIITNSSPDVNHNTDENVRQVPKTDDVNRPLMMINGSTSAGEQINTSMFSTGIYANASTKMIIANGFIKAGSSDSYILLGGGNHKALSDFSMSHEHPYLPLAGGTMTGTIKFNGNTSLPQKALYFICGIDAFADGGEMGWMGGPEFVNQFAPTKTGIGASGTWNINISGNADTVDGYHATYGNNKPWGTIPVITTNGWMDVGKLFEFHYDNTTGSDYSTILRCSGNYSNIVDLPSISGTLALLTDNVASATKLQTTRILWGQPFDGTGNVDGSLHIYSTGDNYSEGIRMHQASNGWCGIIMCGSDNTGSLGTSTNTWGMWNHGSGNLRISRGSTSDNIKSLEWGDYLTINNMDHRINVNAYPENEGQAALRVNVLQATNAKWTRVASFHYPNARENDIVLITVGRDITLNTPSGNLAYFGFGYVASGSASNFITLGFQGYDDLLTVLRSGNVGIGTKSPSHKLHVIGDVFSTTGFKKAGSSDDYVLLGGGGHRLFSDMAAGVHSHSYITIPECSTLNENSDVFRVEWKGGSNSVATKPSGVDAFGVMKLRTARGWYGQILMSTNTAKGIYYRNAEGITSSVGWIKLLDSTHLFWGQSFNGTNSISGNLSEVGSISRANADAVNTDIYGNLKFRKLNSQANCWWLVTLANDIAVLAVHNNGNVGIGTTTPSYKLLVIGDIATSTHIYLNSSQCSWLSGQKDTNAALNIGNSADSYAYWPWFRQTNTYSSKWFSVGTLNTSLYFIGSAISRTANGYDYGFVMDFSNGNFSSQGNVYATHFYENSDIRYKEILNNLTIAINTIANLPLFDFKWKENNTIGTGTSAQVVQQILPNIVSGTDKLTLDYGVLGTIAGITACKELVTLKSELQELKEKVKLLEDRLHKYENTL